MRESCPIFALSNKMEAMKIKMSLTSKGIKVEKVCTTEREAFIFERDMPAKYNLLFSGKPYVIGRINLEELTFCIYPKEGFKQ